jgi:hypothetical protein
MTFGIQNENWFGRYVYITELKKLLKKKCRNIASPLCSNQNDSIESWDKEVSEFLKEIQCHDNFELKRIIK